MREKVKIALEVEAERVTCDGCGAAETTKPESVVRAERHYDNEHLTCTSWRNDETIRDVTGLVVVDPQPLPGGGLRFVYGPALCLTCRIVAWDAMRKVIPALQNLSAKVIQ